MNYNLLITGKDMIENSQKSILFDIKNSVSESPIEKNNFPSQEPLPPGGSEFIYKLEVNQKELQIQNEELRRTQEDILSSNHMYFKLFNEAPVGYFTLNENGETQNVNLTAAKMLGETQSTLANQRFVEHIYPEDQYKYYVLNENLLKSGSVQKCELRILRNDKTFFWAEIEAKFYMDDCGFPICCLILDNISDRKNAEEKIIKSEKRYLSIIEDQTELICRYLPNGKLSFVNGAYSRYYKRNPEDLINVNFIPNIPEPDISMILEKIAGISALNPVVSFEHRIITDDNEIRHQSWTQRGIYTEEGNLIEYQAVGNDITERKISEQKIESLLAEKELILHEVHHRMKNNMNIVYGLLRRQSNSLSDSSAKEVLEDAAGRIFSMMHLYDSLFQSETITELSIKTYLTHLINSIINIFPTAKSVKLVFDIDNIILKAKKLFYIGILINEIITNIMKFAFAGCDDCLIKIQIKERNNQILIMIEDNGCGIPESIEIKKSAGFGMHLVGILAEQLNGIIKIERENGSRFILEFEK